MPTRTYPRTGGTNAACHRFQLAQEIDVALARTGTEVNVTPTEISVNHVQLVEADDATISGLIAGYVFNPTFGESPERLALKNTIPTLRAWADDAEGALATWDGQSTAQRFAVLKVVIQRFGILVDRMADVLQVQGLNNGG